ncbi:WSC domain-containing protein ARB_07870-like [Anneissia japonica]|uniref:WSC domain-containing protein ARB_07870-like n=1 Tax=Anneissia japonica TaxID=1529436 RepID=UPI0014258B60|nr:WSC domain-containing protein ARB_07870-like [Anneissia japonica]
MLQPVSKLVTCWVYSVYLLFGNPTLAQSGVYQGCFADSPNRTMLTSTTNNDMTIIWCIQYCHERRYLYAGLQYRFQCFCGDDNYSRLGQRPESECGLTCSGNSEEICGGSWRNSVYTTGTLRL